MSHPGVSALRAALQQGDSPIIVEGLKASSAAVVLAAMEAKESSDVSRIYLVVLNDEEEAGYFYHDMAQLLGAERVAFLPSTYRRSVKYAQRDAANEILRTDVITRLNDWSAATSPSFFLVTFPTALAEKVTRPEEMTAHTIKIKSSAEYELSELTSKLDALGFQRKDYVYEPGEYAVRGSILDVFSFSSEYPYRIDFFGDEVDSIRTFEVQSQLSKSQCDAVSIVPEANHVQGALVPFTALLPQQTCLVCRDLTYITERIQSIYDEGFARQAVAEYEVLGEMDAAAHREALNAASLLSTGAAIYADLSQMQRINLGRLHGEEKGASATITFQTKPQPLFHKHFDLLREAINRLHKEGYVVDIYASTEKQSERLREILADAPVNICFQTSPMGDGSGIVLHAGFVDATCRRALFTDHEIFDRFHKYNLRSDHARNAKIALTLKELTQFEYGDYVVHIDHGIGQYAGMMRLPSADGSMQEMIKLNYLNGAAVFVSIHSLHKVSKYKGKEGTPPRMSHLGTAAWDNLKERTKKKIKDIARDLIRLYAARREERGYAFAPDSYMQKELEASFRYEDTPDQLKVTQQIKADMERVRPMDRLVCGDVGFGKTEIAIRAAFKAASDSKQVAVLVPTTVLAMQHYRTFSRRLKEFPVRIEYLSRARTAKQTKAVLEDLAAGKVDIIIGTHKLIGKQVKFKDLGLLIIDEEQKFGVSVKEKLRQLKVNVDTLTMTATPIPRTLQFSLMGARDLSMLQTPPPNRHPIQTEVHTFGSDIIADAVNFELSRSGQVYIVTNRISSIPNIERIIQQHVPDARVVVGHGQMAPDKLERIITDFINQDYDVLISTTIIENGIDIPNANTIIIDNAHHFGLSDLHQMRGRVGRGSRKAFCYLLAPPLALLPDDSRRRLEAIESFSDLGSGIHIAMQDLDIRGAGNLLGAEQSGFIADLGYETYIKVLNEAVAELMNESDMPSSDAAPCSGGGSECDGVQAYYVAECNIECDLNVYFPEWYVPGDSERMLLYRELDGLFDDGAIALFRQRLEDRFGALPHEAEELLLVGTLRRLGRVCGCERLVLKNGRMTLYFVTNPQSPFYASERCQHIVRYVMQPAHASLCHFSAQPGNQYLRIKGIHSIREALTFMQHLAE